MTIGTLCVLDDEPREICAADLEVLSDFACAAEALFESRMVSLRAAEATEERRLMVEHLKRERH